MLRVRCAGEQASVDSQIDSQALVYILTQSPVQSKYRCPLDKAYRSRALWSDQSSCCSTVRRSSLFRPGSCVTLCLFTMVKGRCLQRKGSIKLVTDGLDGWVSLLDEGVILLWSVGSRSAYSPGIVLPTCLSTKERGIGDMDLKDAVQRR